MIRRLGALITAVTAVAILQAYTSAEQADARSTVAATAVRQCSVVTAHSRRSGSSRILSSASLTKAQHYCLEAHQHISVLRFWYGKKHRWTLYLNQADKRCWEVSLAGPLKLCMKARALVRQHTQRLVQLDARIRALLPKAKVPHDWLYYTFVCIHGGEGSWTDNTGNGFYGGLQMDLTFQRRYGADFLARWGTANNWPPWAQITAAIRAYRSGRKFGPWPTAGPPCAARFSPAV